MAVLYKSKVYSLKVVVSLYKILGVFLSQLVVQVYKYINLVSFQFSIGL